MFLASCLFFVCFVFVCLLLCVCCVVVFCIFLSMIVFCICICCVWVCVRCFGWCSCLNMYLFVFMQTRDSVCEVTFFGLETMCGGHVFGLCLFVLCNCVCFVSMSFVYLLLYVCCVLVFRLFSCYFNMCFCVCLCFVVLVCVFV